MSEARGAGPVFTVLLYFCRTQEGPAYSGLFNFCRSVCTSVSIWLSCILHGQYTSDPQYFENAGPTIKLLVGGLIRGAPDPLNPPYGRAEIYFGGLLLMDHSDHHRVKYLCDALDFKYHLGYPWGVPDPPYPLPP